MKRSLTGFLTIATILTVACSSGTPLPAGVSEPNYTVRVVPGQFTPNSMVSQVDLTVEVHIENPGTVDLRLTRIELRSAGTNNVTVSGPARTFDDVIPAGQSGTFPMYVTATVTGVTPESTEPTRLRGTATFDVNPAGKEPSTFRSVFMLPLNGIF